MSSARTPLQSAALPTSLVYRMSCEHFSRPLLVQQVCPKPTMNPLECFTQKYPLCTLSVLMTHSPAANVYFTRPASVLSCQLPHSRAHLLQQHEASHVMYGCCMKMPGAR